MPKMLFAEDLYSPSQVEDLARKGMIVEKEISKSEQKSFDKALKLDRAKPDVASLGERATIQDFLDKRSSESKAAAEQRMQEYKEGRAKSMEQFNANMQKISEAHDAKMKDLRNTTKSGGGGGGAMPKSNRDITKNYKKGGKVSSASKRADGCAIRGKTRA
jgi:hypothetical protein